MVNRKHEITRRFRKVAWGRLYWKRANWRWRNTFDSDDVCIVRDGGSTMHYKSLDALIENIEYAERVSGPALFEPQHTGFYVQTEAGNTAHVLGDPNMAEETAKALANLIDCAVKWISSDDYSDTTG